MSTFSVEMFWFIFLHISLDKSYSFILNGNDESVHSDMASRNRGK